MDVPEKIYIPTILVANTVRYKEEGSIEYIRKNAFIEKASEWFKIRYEWIDIDGTRNYDMGAFEDFRKYMGGE